jgi:hypothetical protein
MPGGGVHAGIEAERLSAVAERKQIGDQAAEPTIALGLERQGGQAADEKGGNEARD